jgi:hypothetical protein
LVNCVIKLPFPQNLLLLRKIPLRPPPPDWKTDPIANQSTHPCKHRRQREDRPSHLLYLLHYQSPPPLQTRPLPVPYVSFLLDQNRVELLMLFPSNRPSLVIPMIPNQDETLYLVVIFYFSPRFCQWQPYSPTPPRTTSDKPLHIQKVFDP